MVFTVQLFGIFLGFCDGIGHSIGSPHYSENDIVLHLLRQLAASLVSRHALLNKC